MEAPQVPFEIRPCMNPKLMSQWLHWKKVKMKIQKNAIKQMAYRDMALPSMSTGNYFNDIRVSIPSVPVISGPLLRGSLDTPLTVIQA